MCRLSNYMPLLEPPAGGPLGYRGHGTTVEKCYAMMVVLWAIALSDTEEDIENWPKRPAFTSDDSQGRTLLVPLEWDMVATERAYNAVIAGDLAPLRPPEQRKSANDGG